jgi:L-asparagine transporter-like permease
MTISFMFALGDVEADLSHPSGQPWVAVILRVTSSRAAIIVSILIMMFMYFFCAVNQVTTSSRQVFAFARDKGLPCHEFLSRVDRKGVPANAVYVTFAYTCILALIIIGSTTAFNIILSVSATGLFTSYLVVIGTVLARKLRNEPFPTSRFEIPRYCCQCHRHVFPRRRVLVLVLSSCSSARCSEHELEYSDLRRGDLVLWTVLSCEGKASVPCEYPLIAAHDDTMVH